LSKPLPKRPRGEASLDLPTQPLGACEPKQAWIYRELRDRILGRVLSCGARLPSTRSLAERWKVSRTTVALAYDQLRSEGYLVSQGGSGTYVAAEVPDTLSTVSPGKAPATVRSQPVDATANAVVNQPFVARIADPSLFPMDAWRKALAASARKASARDLAEVDPMGVGRLREEIAKYLNVARGIACGAGQVLVLSGIRHGLELSARQLLSGADMVAVEDPGYRHAEPIFGRFCRSVLRIPVDGQGCSVAHLRAAGNVRLVHVTPAHQSPTGVTMPISRRLDLLRWAAEADRWIIEDDYDSEFSYDSAPLPALKSLDSADRVIHCGSFNKTMFGALRIGYIVLPAALVPRFRQAKHVTGRANGTLEQLALASFLASGAFARHVRRTRLVYADRRDVVLGALRNALGARQLVVTGAQAGFHMVWWPPEGFDVPRFHALAHAAGMQLPAISEFCERTDLPAGLVIGYTGLSDEAVRRHARALGRAIEETLDA